MFDMTTSISRVSIYFVLLSLFHFSEWYVTVVYRPKEATYESWCLDHSRAYTVAQLLSITEYTFSSLMIGEKINPSLNMIWSISTLIMCCVALGTRIVAMITAGNNFNHRVQLFQTSEHELITSGIYSRLRHPSYFGWFFWSVGSQLFLQNIICSIGFFYFGVKFFSDRIPMEEWALRNKYKDTYEKYAKETPIFIPFVKDSFQKTD